MSSLPGKWTSVRLASVLFVCTILGAAAPPSAGAAESLVHGVVLDSLGRPVVGASIEIVSSTRQEETTSTRNDGSYSLTVPAGTYSLTISTGEHGYEEHEGLTLDANVANLIVAGDTTEDFTMPALGSLAVEVLNAEGNPVEASLGGSNVRNAPDEPSETSEGTPVTYSSNGSGASTGPNYQHVFYALPGMAWKWNAEVSGGLSSPEVEGETTLQGNKITLTLPAGGLLAQSVVFDSFPPPSPNVGSVYTVSVAASSSLPVSLSIDPASAKKVCSLSGDTVSFTREGKCVIDANQTGDMTYQAAPEAIQTISVAALKASTITALSLSSPDIKYGDEHTEIFTATVTVAGGGIIPVGKVRVMAGSTTLCNIKLTDGTGTCSPKIKALKTGSYSVSATLVESSHFASSTSESINLEVS